MEGEGAEDSHPGGAGASEPLTLWEGCAGPASPPSLFSPSGMFHQPVSGPRPAQPAPHAGYPPCLQLTDPGALEGSRMGPCLTKALGVPGGGAATAPASTAQTAGSPGEDQA